MPEKSFPKKAFLAKANGRRPVGQPRTTQTNYIEDVGWNCLGLHLSETMEVMEDHTVCQLYLELLSPGTLRKKRAIKKEENINVLFQSFLFEMCARN